MIAHLEWETLNDYVDAALSTDQRAMAARHLDHCTECRDRLAELRCLLAAASDVPERVEPPDDLWPALRAEIVRRQAPLTLGARPAPDVAPIGISALSASRWRGVPMLAAAGLALVIASSAVTALLLQGSDAPRGSAIADGPSTPLARVRALPASLAFTERAYLGTAEALQATLDAQRDSLAPETIATIERSLAEIDHAIAEARSALLRDPGSQVLADLFIAGHRHKLDLLRRASELPAQI